MYENLKLFRGYDTKTKEYLHNYHTKEIAKICRDEKEHALPHFKNCEGATMPPLQPKYIIQQNKHYKYRFQIRRAIDHRKGEN